MFEFEKSGQYHFTISRQVMVNSLASLKYLCQQVKENQDVPYENMGICGNWESESSYALVAYFGSQWPKTAYPKEFHAHPIEYDVPLWKGNNRELRIDLMEFIISKLEQLIIEDSHHRLTT